MLYTRKKEKHNSVPQSQYIAVWFLISMCFMKDFHWEIQHTCQLTPKKPETAQNPNWSQVTLGK